MYTKYQIKNIHMAVRGLTKAMEEKYPEGINKSHTENEINEYLELYGRRNILLNKLKTSNTNAKINHQ